MLDSRNIKTVRPNKSLDHKNLGPFQIIKAHNNSAYELDLPSSINKIYSVFHSWLLHLNNSDPLSEQRISSPSPLEIDEEGALWEVDEILDSRIDGRRKDPLTGKKGYLMYKIKYSGPETHNNLL